MERKIAAKLTTAFTPQRLSVQNVSARHADHQDRHGPDATGETHFDVLIVADSFVGRSRIERHRMVYTALVEELAVGVHALAVMALAPGEWGTDGE